jgi:glycine/D-amino acid oxidase-like deaminating enzyme/nitrite reductase/ring-hydroxylating ferredoxin subunit
MASFQIAAKEKPINHHKVLEGKEFEQLLFLIKMRMVLRDGARKSLWQETVSGYLPAIEQSQQQYDVIIAGGGITGVTLGVLLQEAGKKCLLLEAQTLGFGTTGGTTAHLNTFMDTPYPKMIENFGLENARLVATAAREAVDLIKSNIEKYGIDCGFEEVPGYLFSQNASQTSELEEIENACREVGVSCEFVNELPMPLPFEKVLKIARQGKFHPLRYLQKMAEVFEKQGGTIIENCRVLGSKKSDNALVEVETTTENFTARHLVFATHIPIGVNIIHFRCPAYRSYAMAVKLDNNSYPESLVYDMYDPYHYYRTQNIDGENYLIVGGEDHRTGEETNTNGCFLKLESHVRSHFDVASVVSQWSSQYFEPADGLPYIGHLPGNPENVLVATGYGGNGMTYSHVAAITLSNMINGRQTNYQELFRPSRLKPVAGFTEFVKHNAEVVKQFVGGWLGIEKLDGAANIAYNDATIVRYEGESIALYKDEAGQFHAVSPACTHVKCSVAWNAAEKSWDCPCHGARYSIDGEVLTGPASRDLEKIELRTLIEKHESQ